MRSNFRLTRHGAVPLSCHLVLSTIVSTLVLAIPFSSFHSFLVRLLRIVTSLAALDVVHDSFRLGHCSSYTSLCGDDIVQLCSCHIEGFFFVHICEAPVEYVIFGISCTCLVPGCRFASGLRLIRVPDDVCCSNAPARTCAAAPTTELARNSSHALLSSVAG